MVIRSINLETVCGVTSTLPVNDKPEVAFAGKSNVGKSSLINTLMNRKAYARISATPGKTQTINFYNINDELYLVDLPGYGYARVSEKEKDLLASCYRSCLAIADEKGLTSIAFCCISTGEFHFPNELAAEVATSAVRKYLQETGSQLKVVFNVFKDEDRRIYERLLGKHTEA